MEIILEGRYLNRTTERRAFYCQSISERPAKYVNPMTRYDGAASGEAILC